MWTRGLLKKNARVAFQRNYVSCLLVSLITMILGGGMVSYSVGVNYGNEQEAMQFQSYEEMYEYISNLISQIPPYMIRIFLISFAVAMVFAYAVAILVSNVVTVGCNRFFLENREHKTEIVKMFYGFSNGRYSKSVVTMFLRSLYVFLWSILFLIPGIIKSYAYMLVPYILAENPDLDNKRVFALSEEMMRGHKWEAFVLGLSFFGWILLGALTGGIVNLFYVNPYMHATYAEFYSAVKAEALQKGIATAEELPGVVVPEVEIPFV